MGCDSPPPRTVLHLDVDAFLASVEVALHPELAGKPLVIGGDPKKRSIVMSSSYEARAYGVRPGIHLSDAKRRCPHAIFRKGDSGAANRMRSEITRILFDFTPHVAVTSIDDFLVDLTDARRIWPVPALAAKAIKERVRDEVHLPLSIGIGANPLLARLAGKLAKPGKIAELLPGLEDAWLRGLPVTALPGVGHAIGKKLAAFSIQTVADLRLVSRELLFASFGRPGLVLFDRARGIDATRVEPTHWIDKDGKLAARPPKSIRREASFEPEEARLELVEAMLAYLTERATAKLREAGLVARSIEVSLRYVDTRSERQADASGAPAKTHRKQRRLKTPSDATLETFEHAKKLLQELPRRRALVKRVGITLLNLAPQGGWQQHLFDDEPTPSTTGNPTGPAQTQTTRSDRHRKLDCALDELRQKVGFGRILRGSSMPLSETHPHGEDGFELRTPSLNQ